MSLEQWLANGWIMKIAISKADAASQLAIADREVKDASTSGLSDEGIHQHAYNACLRLCSAALNSRGYKSAKGKSSHYYTIESLLHTLGERQRGRVIFLHACSKLRHQSTYDDVGFVQRQDALDLLRTAQDLQRDVLSWLRAEHPDWSL